MIWIILFASILGTIALILFGLILIKFWLWKLERQLNNELTKANQDQNNLIFTLKRIENIRNQNQAFAQEYKALNALNSLVEVQKNELDVAYQNLILALNLKSLFNISKLKKIYLIKKNYFNSNILKYKEIAKGLKSDWDSTDSDISILLTQLTQAKRYLENNQKILSNIYSELFNQVKNYSSTLTNIDNSLVNQGNFEQINQTLDGLQNQINHFFTYLNHAKNIEFSLFLHLPYLFHWYQKDLDELEMTSFFKVKNEFNALQNNFNQYELAMLEFKIKEFYRYFFKQYLEDTKQKTLRLFKEDYSPIINQIVESVQFIKDLDFANIRIINELNDLMNYRDFLLDERDFEEYFTSLENFLESFFNLQILLNQEKFEHQRQRFWEDSNNREIQDSIKWYFEIMQHNLVLSNLNSSKFRDKIRQLQELYQNYFSNKTTLKELKPIWNAWVELLAFFIEQIALNEQYKEYCEFLYVALKQKEKSILQYDHSFQQQIHNLMERSQYVEAFKLLKAQI